MKWHDMLKKLTLLAATAALPVSAYADIFTVNEDGPFTNIVTPGGVYTVTQDGPYTNVVGPRGTYTISQDGPYFNVIDSGSASGRRYIFDPGQMPYVPTGEPGPPPMAPWDYLLQGTK
jgi:hypothetical protein